MIESVEEYLNNQKTEEIIGKKSLSEDKIKKILSVRPRIEKIAVKDVKLRTFITEDNSRDDLVEHVYDITYGVVNSDDTLVIIDDSIVRGTTLKKSILKMLDRLNPKKIVIVSSAPQIRYPDCYGIDMANLESLVAFNAALSLLKDRGMESLIKETYDKCKKELELDVKEMKNHVKEIYDAFTPEEISDRITQLLSSHLENRDVKIIFQSIENLHQACPDSSGDWYFTGNYPTPGGNRVVNTAFVNFFEGNKKRAY
tara:strand:- start:1333 stop:2100 length:768 start_codon:yes stop_codon:yes gene_type:complete